MGSPIIPVPSHPSVLIFFMDKNQDIYQSINKLVSAVFGELLDLSIAFVGFRNLLKIGQFQNISRLRSRYT